MDFNNKEYYTLLESIYNGSKQVQDIFNSIAFEIFKKYSKDYSGVTHARVEYTLDDDLMTYFYDILMCFNREDPKDYIAIFSVEKNGDCDFYNEEEYKIVKEILTCAKVELRKHKINNIEKG
jgi:hypothetical protein